MSSQEETNGKPVIRDLRRIDPATGQVRDSGQGGSAQPGSRGPSKPRGKHVAAKPGGAASMGAAAPAGPGARTKRRTRRLTFRPPSSSSPSARPTCSG